MFDALRAYLGERPLIEGIGPAGRRTARQAYQGRFATALLVAGALHVTLTAAVISLRLGGAPPASLPPGTIMDFMKPPRIFDRPVAPEAPPSPPSGPKVFKPSTDGVPIPAPDPVSPTIPTVDQRSVPGIVAGEGINEGTGGGGEGVGGAGVGDGTGAGPEDRPDPGTYSLVEKQPVLVDGPKPIYPELARMSQIEGTVRLRALVGTDGKVHEVIVLQGVHDLLDQAAIEATKGYVFLPAQQNGRPVAIWVNIPFRFALH
jgi:periplasmic protein TonB